MIVLTTPNPPADSDDAAVATVKRMALAAVATTLIAVIAGVALLVIDPAAGSTTQGAFGLTAAVSGLSTAVLAIATVVLIQVKGLWDRVPIRLRMVAWGVLGVLIVHNIVTQLAHLL